MSQSNNKKQRRNKKKKTEQEKPAQPGPAQPNSRLFFPSDAAADQPSFQHGARQSKVKPCVTLPTSSTFTLYTSEPADDLPCLALVSSRFN